MTTDTHVRDAVRTGRGRVAPPGLEEAELEEAELEEAELEEAELEEAELEEAELEEGVAEEEEPSLAAARLTEEEEEAEEEQEEAEAEAGLDELLRLQLAGGAPEEPVLFEDEEVEARVRPADEDVRPRAADEFVCRGCFLVKSQSQLADAERSLCRDCADDAGAR